MRPDARVWRKHQRDAAKGVPTGRRATHKAETQEPQPGSTWTRRHLQAPPLMRPCQVGRCTRWDATRRPTSVYACPDCWAGIERMTAQYQQDTAGAQ
jgi:hypothetical protein